MGGQDTKAIKVGPDGVGRGLLDERQVRGGHRPLPLGGRRRHRRRPRRDRPAVAPGEGARAAHLRLHGLRRVATSCPTWPSARRSRTSWAASTRPSPRAPCRWSGAWASRTRSPSRAACRANIGMVRALEEVLGRSLNVSEEGHFMGALGAALFALERAQAGARGEPVAEGAGRSLSHAGRRHRHRIRDDQVRARGRGGRGPRARTGEDQGRLREGVARGARGRVRRRGGATRVGYVATTGLGRYAVPFRDIQITDLTCGARGAATLFPDGGASCSTSAPSARAPSACATAARSRSST